MGANGSTAASCSSLDISEGQRRRFVSPQAQAKPQNKPQSRHYDGQYRNLQHNQHEQQMLKYRKQQQHRAQDSSHQPHGKLKQSSSHFDLSAISANHHLDHEQFLDSRQQAATGYNKPSVGQQMSSPTMMTSSNNNHYESGKPVMVLPVAPMPQPPLGGRLIHAKKSNAGVASKILQHRQQQQQQNLKKFSDSLPSLNNIILASPDASHGGIGGHQSNYQSQLSPQILIDRQAAIRASANTTGAATGGSGFFPAIQCHQPQNALQAQQNNNHGAKIYQPSHINTNRVILSSLSPNQVTSSHFNLALVSNSNDQHSTSFYQQQPQPHTNNQSSLSPHHRQYHRHHQPSSSLSANHNHSQYINQQQLDSSRNSNYFYHIEGKHQLQKHQQHQQQFMKRATSLSSLHNLHNNNLHYPPASDNFDVASYTNDYHSNSTTNSSGIANESLLVGNSRHKMISRPAQQPPVVVAGGLVVQSQKVLSTKNNNNHLSSAMIQQQQQLQFTNKTGHSQPFKQLANGNAIGSSSANGNNRPESMNSNYDHYQQRENYHHLADPLHRRQSLSSYLNYGSPNGSSPTIGMSNQSPAPMANNHNHNHHHHNHNHGIGDGIGNGKKKLHKFKQQQQQVVATSGHGGQLQSQPPSRYKSKLSKHQQQQQQQQQGCPVLPPLPRSQSLHELIQLRATENGQRMRNTGTLRGPLSGGTSDGQPLASSGAKVNLVAELLESRRQQKLMTAEQANQQTQLDSHQQLVVSAVNITTDGLAAVSSESSSAKVATNLLSSSQCSSSDDGIHDISLSAGEQSNLNSNSAITTSCSSSDSRPPFVGSKMLQGRPGASVASSPSYSPQQRHQPQQPVLSRDDKRRFSQDAEAISPATTTSAGCHQSRRQQEFGQGERRYYNKQPLGNNSKAAGKYQPGKSTLKRSLSHSALQQSLASNHSSKQEQRHLHDDNDVEEDEDGDRSEDLNELAKFLYQFKQRQAVKEEQVKSLSSAKTTTQAIATSRQQQIKLANQTSQSSNSDKRTAATSGCNNDNLRVVAPLTTTATNESQSQSSSTARHLANQQKQKQQQQSPSSTTSSSGFASSTCGTSNSISSTTSSDDCNGRVNVIRSNGITSKSPPVNSSSKLVSHKKYPAPQRPDTSNTSSIYRSELQSTGNNLTLLINSSASSNKSTSCLISGKLKLSSSLLSIVDEYNNNNNNISTLLSAKSNKSSQQPFGSGNNLAPVLMGVSSGANGNDKLAREQAESQIAATTGGNDSLTSSNLGRDEGRDEDQIESCQLEQLKRYTQLRQMSQSELALNHLTSSVVGGNGKFRGAVDQQGQRKQQQVSGKQPYKSRLINLIRRISDKSSSSASIGLDQNGKTTSTASENKKGQSISCLAADAVGGQQLLQHQLQQQQQVKYQVNGKRGEQKGLPVTQGNGGGDSEVAAIDQSHMISANLNQSIPLMNGNFRRHNQSQHHESSVGVEEASAEERGESEETMRSRMEGEFVGKTRVASHQEQEQQQQQVVAPSMKVSGCLLPGSGNNNGRAGCSSGYNNNESDAQVASGNNNRRLAASGYLSESLCDLNFDCDFELIKNCGHNNTGDRSNSATTSVTEASGELQAHNRSTGGLAANNCCASLSQHHQHQQACKGHVTGAMATGAPPSTRSNGQRQQPLVAGGDSALVVGAAANHRKLKQKPQTGNGEKISPMAIDSHSHTNCNGNNKSNEGNWRLAPNPLSLVVQPTQMAAGPTGTGCCLSTSTTSTAASTSCLGGVIQSVAVCKCSGSNDRNRKSSGGCVGCSHYLASCKSNPPLVVDKSSASSALLSSSGATSGGGGGGGGGGVGSKLRWLMNSGAKKNKQQADGKTGASGKSRLAKLISSSGTQQQPQQQQVAATSAAAVAPPLEAAPSKSGARTGKQVAAFNGQSLMGAGDNNKIQKQQKNALASSPLADQLTNEADQLLVELDQSLDLVSKKRANHRYLQEHQHRQQPLSCKSPVSWWKATGDSGSGLAAPLAATTGSDTTNIDAYDVVSRTKSTVHHHRDSSGPDLDGCEDRATNRRKNSFSDSESNDDDHDNEDEDDYASLNRAMINEIFDVDPSEVLTSSSSNRAGEITSNKLEKHQQQVSPSSPSHSFTFSAPNSPAPSIACCDSDHQVVVGADSCANANGTCDSQKVISSSSLSKLAPNISPTSATSTNQMDGESDSKRRGQQQQQSEQVNGHSRVHLCDSGQDLRVETENKDRSEQADISKQQVAASGDVGRANKGSCLKQQQQQANKFECAIPSCPTTSKSMAETVTKAVIVNSSSSSTTTNQLDESGGSSSKTNTTHLANNHLGGKVVVGKLDKCGNEVNEDEDQWKVRAETGKQEGRVEMAVDQTGWCSSCRCASKGSSGNANNSAKEQLYDLEGVRSTAASGEQQQGNHNNPDIIMKSGLQVSSDEASRSASYRDNNRCSSCLQAKTDGSNSNIKCQLDQRKLQQRNPATGGCGLGFNVGGSGVGRQNNESSSLSGEMVSGAPIQGHSCGDITSSTSFGARCGLGNNQPPMVVCHGRGVTLAAAESTVNSGVSSATGCRAAHSAIANGKCYASGSGNGVGSGNGSGIGGGIGIGVKRNTAGITLMDGSSPSNFRICISGEDTNNRPASRDNRVEECSSSKCSGRLQCLSKGNGGASCGGIKCPSSVSGTSCIVNATCESATRQLGSSHQFKLVASCACNPNSYPQLTGHSHVNNGNEMHRLQKQQELQTSNCCPVAALEPNGNKCPRSSATTTVNNKLISLGNGSAIKKPTGGCQCCSSAASACSKIIDEPPKIGNGVEDEREGGKCDKSSANRERRVEDKSSVAFGGLVVDGRRYRRQCNEMGTNMPTTCGFPCGCSNRNSDGDVDVDVDVDQDEESRQVDEMGAVATCDSSCRVNCLDHQKNHRQQVSRCNNCSCSSDKIIKSAVEEATNNLLVKSGAGEVEPKGVATSDCRLGVARRTTTTNDRDDDRRQFAACHCHLEANLISTSALAIPRHQKQQQQVSKCSHCLIGLEKGKLDPLSKVTPTTNAICRSNSELVSGCNNLVTSRQVTSQTNGQFGEGDGNRRQQLTSTQVNGGGHLMLFGKLRNSLLSATGNSSSSASSSSASKLLSSYSPLGKTSQKLASSQISLASSGLVAHLGSRGKLYNDGTFIVKSEQQKTAKDNFDDNFILRRKTPNAGLKSRC